MGRHRRRRGGRHRRRRGARRNNGRFLDFAVARYPFCQWCGRPVTRRTATCDHVIPLSKGGTNLWWNRVVSCLDCNHRKGNKLPTKAPRGPADWEREYRDWQAAQFERGVATGVGHVLKPRPDTDYEALYDPREPP